MCNFLLNYCTLNPKPFKNLNEKWLLKLLKKGAGVNVNDFIFMKMYMRRTFGRDTGYLNSILFFVYLDFFINVLYTLMTINE